MKAVLDTSAIIYLQDFRKFEEIFTTNSVVAEVKDRISSLKLPALNAKILEPDKKFVNEVKDVAKKTGDLEKLSATDIEVLALAKELNATLISDDRNVQNVAERIGIAYVSLFSKKIKELFVWGKFCPGCKKFLDNKFAQCPICGSDLKRIPRKKSKIKKSS